MSTVNRLGGKVILPRIGREHFWDDIREHFAGAEPQKWKVLAMLALRVNACWSLDMIGNAFGHERGHISRSLSELCRELQEHFEWAPDEQETAFGE